MPVWVTLPVRFQLHVGVGRLNARRRVAAARQSPAGSSLCVMACAPRGARRSRSGTIRRFALYRQAMRGAWSRRTTRAPRELAEQAIAQLSESPRWRTTCAGQAAAAQARWDEAAAAPSPRRRSSTPARSPIQRDLGASLEQLGQGQGRGKAYEAALALRDQDELRARLALMLAENGEEPTAIDRARDPDRAGQQDSRGVGDARPPRRTRRATGRPAEKAYAQRRGPEGRRPELVQPRRRPRPAQGPARRAPGLRAAPPRAPTCKQQAETRPAGSARPWAARPAPRPDAPHPRDSTPFTGPGDVERSRGAQ